jgi:hypothetical protein
LLFKVFGLAKVMHLSTFGKRMKASAVGKENPEKKGRRSYGHHCKSEIEKI